MLIDRACPVMIIEIYRSGTDLYKGFAVNFLHGFNSFSGSSIIPIQAEMTYSFVLVKRLCNNIIAKEKVRRVYFLKLAHYLLQHNPLHARYVISEYAVNALSENHVLQSVIMYYDIDDYANGEKQEPNDSSDSEKLTLSLPQLCGLRSAAEEERLREITHNLVDMNWPTIGYQPIDAFNTEGLAVMCFPDFFRWSQISKNCYLTKGCYTRKC